MSGVYRIRPPRRVYRPFIYGVAATPGAASLVLSRRMVGVARQAPALRRRSIIARFIAFASGPAVVVAAAEAPRIVRIGAYGLLHGAGKTPIGRGF